MVLENKSQESEIIGREARKCSVSLLVILSVGFINLLVQIIPRDDEFV